MTEGTLNMIGAGLGLANTVGQIGTSYANYKLQAENMAYQQDFARNAVSIRMKDLQKAGLNPLLAVGDAASAPSYATPQIQPVDMTQPLSGVAKAQAIASTQAQQKILDFQAEKLKAETIGQQIQNQYAASLAQNAVQKGLLENAFAQAANPQRLRVLESEVSSSHSTAIIKHTEERAAELGVQQQEVDLALKELQRQGLIKTNDLKDQELIAAQIACDAKEIEIEKEGYNVDWAKAHGLPTGMPGLDRWFAGTLEGAGRLFMDPQGTQGISTPASFRPKPESWRAKKKTYSGGAH